MPSQRAHTYVSLALGILCFADPSPGCVDYGDPLPLVGSSYISTRVTGVAFEGNVAVAGIFTAGIVVFDLSDPDSPLVSATFDPPGRVLEVALSGKFAYLGSRALDSSSRMLQIVDVSNPALISDVTIPFDPNDIVIHQKHAFVSDALGLRVLNVADPEAPSLIAELNLPGSVLGLSVQDDHAYLAARDAGLHIVDISTPASPELVRTFALDNVLEVGVSGSRAVVFSWGDRPEPHRLIVLDITDPMFPAIAGERLLPNQSNARFDDLQVVDTSAILAMSPCGIEDCFQSFLEVFDISDAGNFRRGAARLLEGGASNLVFDGRWAVAGIRGDCFFDCVSDPGINVLDAEFLQSPAFVGHSSSETGTSILAAEGNRLAALSRDTLAIFDAPLNALPVERGSLPLSIRRRDVIMHGDFVWVAADSSGVFVIDASNPDLPVVRGQVDTPDLALTIAVDAEFAYVADHGAGLQVLSWADPSAPNIVGSLDLPTRTLDVALEQSLLCAVTDEGLHLVDVADPATPHILDFAAVPGSHKVIYRDGLAYVASSDEYLRVFEAGSSLSQVGEVFVGRISQMILDGSYLYSIAGAVFPIMGFLTVIDVGSPGSPTMATRLEGAQLWYDSIVSNGRHIYLEALTQNGSERQVLWPYCSGVTSIDVSDFQAVQSKNGVQLSWRNGLAYQHAGFHVWRATRPADYLSRLTPVLLPPGTEEFLDPEVASGTTYAYSLQAVDESGTSQMFGPVEVTFVPGAGSTLSNVPNPCNPTTRIHFSTKSNARTTLAVYNIFGRLVRVLVDQKLEGAEHEVWWDGLDERGLPAASGIYVLELRAEGTRQTRKITLVH